MVISEDIDVSYFALSLGEQQVPFLERLECHMTSQFSNKHFYFA
jgi:hypothetical protein